MQIDLGAMLAALIIGGTSIHFGFEALQSPTGGKDGFQAPYSVLGTVALTAALLDLRMVLTGAIKGAHRLARHPWRMCFALLMATASLFLGQPQVFPQPVRKVAVLAAPVPGVLLAMLYWLCRVLLTSRYRRTRNAPQAEPAPALH